MITSVFIGFIGLYATLIYVACSQFEKLRANISLIGNRELNRMQGSGDDSASEGMLEQLKGCIRHHQDIMKYVQTVNADKLSHFPYICFWITHSRFLQVYPGIWRVAKPYTRRNVLLPFVSTVLRRLFGRDGKNFLTKHCVKIRCLHAGILIHELKWNKRLRSKIAA